MIIILVGMILVGVVVSILTGFYMYSGVEFCIIGIILGRVISEFKCNLNEKNEKS